MIRHGLFKHVIPRRHAIWHLRNIKYNIVRLFTNGILAKCASEFCDDITGMTCISGMGTLGIERGADMGAFIADLQLVDR